MRDDGCDDARASNSACTDFRVRSVGHKEHGLKGHGGPDIGRKPIDKKAITRGNAVLMTAVFEDCVCHVCVRRGA